MSDMLSVLIPARNELFLQKTIDCVLEAAEEDIEIIAVCDGYWPNPGIKDDPRVILIHHTEPRGQRQSINEAAKIARGKYVMKLDAHCSVGPGFDRILKADCEYDWTVVPRMHNLDITTFTAKYLDDPEQGIRRGKVHDYMYISGPKHVKPMPGKGSQPYGFRAMYYGKYAGAATKKPKKNDKMLDETMACMGPGWFLHKDRFWELGGCDEKHGGWGQQGVEVSLKAWLSGGKLMVNKNTWFAHWFRGGEQPEGFKGGFPYRMTGREVSNARKHSQDLWLNNKWPQQKRTIEWLVEKFNPSTWNGDGTPMPTNTQQISDERMAMFSTMYRHIHKRKNDTFWRGVPLWKFPTDVTLYQEVIHETQPDWIVEIGTAKGGSALYFQDLLDLIGKGGKVVTVDVRDRMGETPKDPRVKYIIGDSKATETAQQVADTVSGKVMVVIDGNHERTHVKWDLQNYAPLVTEGQYLVIEDCYIDKGLFGPGQARDWFLERDIGRQFEQTNRCEKYLVGMTMGGWLQRI